MRQNSCSKLFFPRSGTRTHVDVNNEELQIFAGQKHGCIDNYSEVAMTTCSHIKSI